jgi:hypothetical protein
MLSRKERSELVRTSIQKEWQAYYMKLVEQYWDNDMHFINCISQNPDLDFNYVTKHPEYNWDYTKFAQNPNLPLEFIIKNIDAFKSRPDNWRHIFKINENLTYEFLIELNNTHKVTLDIITLQERGFFVYKEKLSLLTLNLNVSSFVQLNEIMCQQLLLRDYTFDEAFEQYESVRNTNIKHILPINEDLCDDLNSNLRSKICSRHDFDFTYLDKYEPHRFNWNKLSEHPKLTLDILEKHIRTKPWRFRSVAFGVQTSLSNHPCITFEFVRNNMDLPWSWPDLSKTIDPQIIKDNIELPWELSAITYNIKLTPEFLLKNKFFQWNYNSLMARANFYTNQEFVNYFIQKGLQQGMPNLESLYKMTILQLCEMAKSPTNIIQFCKNILLHLKHKFFMTEYRKHIAAYLIQQRWQTVYMSPYNPIGAKRLCREYDEYERSLQQSCQ